MYGFFPKFVAPIVAIVLFFCSCITMGTGLGANVFCGGGVCFNNSPGVAYSVLLLFFSFVTAVLSSLGGFAGVAPPFFGFGAMISNFFFLFFDLLLVGYFTGFGDLRGSAAASLSFGLFGALLSFVYIYLTYGSHIDSKGEEEDSERSVTGGSASNASSEVTMEVK